MEKSSSMNNTNNVRRAVFSNNNDHQGIVSSGVVSGVQEEESGWTMYFDDFFNEYNNNNSQLHHEDSSSMISIGDQLESSLVSDAASSAAAKKYALDHDHDREQEVLGFSLDKTYDRLSSFKKRKTKVVLLDDDLEDTASSPANSPKVYDFITQLDRKQQHKDIMDISQEKAGSNSRNVQMTEGRRSGFGAINDNHDTNGRSDNDTSELKKKGLCLVPLSMIVNYLD